MAAERTNRTAATDGEGHKDAATQPEAPTGFTQDGRQTGAAQAPLFWRSSGTRRRRWRRAGKAAEGC